MILGTLALSAICSVIYLEAYVGKDPTWRRSLFKTLPVALLAALAWQGLPVWLAFGLTLGAIGDLALSRDGDRAFMAGLISFALSHLAYVVQFLGHAGLMPEATVDVPALPFVIGIVAVAAIMAWKLWPATGPLRIPVMVYIGIIAAMSFAAIPVGPPILWAALLFMLSDAILATELFLLPVESLWRKFLSRMVWITYYLAQFLFVLSYLV